MERSGVRITAEIETSMAMYRGPWPPAAILAEYEERFPGWGVRLLELTEKQVSHRQGLEARQVEQIERRMDAGQKLSFAIAALSVVSATSILIFALPNWFTAIAALGIVVVGVGGPTVARVFATKFTWPGARDKATDKKQS